MAYVVITVILAMTSLTLVLGQRPFFAGTRPIGYPERVQPAADELGNRFGDADNSTTTTTQKLPLEALGNKELVDRLSKLPVDKQPFWLINWQALENHRKNPQTYPQRPSPFLETTKPDQTSGNGNSNLQNSNLQNRFSAPTNVNSSDVNPNDFNSEKGNRTFVSSSNAASDNNRKLANTESLNSHSPNTNLNNKPNNADPSSSTASHYASGIHRRPSATAKPNTSKATSKNPNSGLTHALPDFYDDLDIDLHNGHLNTDIKKKQKLQQQQQAQSNVPLSIYDLYF